MDAQDRASRIARLLTDCQECGVCGGDYTDILEAHHQDIARDEARNEAKDEEAAIALEPPPPSYQGHTPAKLVSYRPRGKPPAYIADYSPPSYFVTVSGIKFPPRRQKNNKRCSVGCSLCVLAGVFIAAVIGGMIYFYAFYMEQPENMLMGTKHQGHN